MNSLRILVVLGVAALAACATPAAVVFVSHGHDASRVRRVAVLNIGDYLGVAGSGEIAASSFEKYLMWAGYNLVERRQVSQILKEQSLDVSGSIDVSTIRSIGRILGVDALALGNLTDFSNTREHTVIVDVPQEQMDPIYGQVVTTQHTGDTQTTVTTIQNVVTGYNYSQTYRLVPELQTFPAHVGLSVRLVDVQTGEVLWSASASSDGVDITSATEQSSSKIMQAVVKELKKAASPSL